MRTRCTDLAFSHRGPRYSHDDDLEPSGGREGIKRYGSIIVERNTAITLSLALIFILALAITLIPKGTLSEKKLKLVQGELTIMISRVPDVRQAQQTGRPSPTAMGGEADGEGGQKEMREEDGEGESENEGKRAAAAASAATSMAGGSTLRTADAGAGGGDGDGESIRKPTSSNPTESQRSVPRHGGEGSQGEKESLFGGTITLRLDLHDAPDPVHEWWESTDNTPKVNALLQGEVVGATFSSDLHASDDVEMHAQVNDRPAFQPSDNS
jgi:hypothetical protein